MGVHLLERGDITLLKVYDAESQPATVAVNACATSKCPGICLNTPQGPVCRCPDNFTLNANGLQCIPQVMLSEPSENCTSGFQCIKSKQCVNTKDVCDGFDDCNDGSDESSISNGPCNINKCDLNLHFVCNNRCYQRALLCSSIVYCKDGTDQQNCETHTCNNNEFTCAKSGKCIQLSWVNDGVADCGEYIEFNLISILFDERVPHKIGPDDSSDEMTEFDIEEKCPEFDCKNGKCRPFSDVCDGIDQCG